MRAFCIARSSRPLQLPVRYWLELREILALGLVKCTVLCSQKANNGQKCHSCGKRVTVHRLPVWNLGPSQPASSQPGKYSSNAAGAVHEWLRASPNFQKRNWSVSLSSCISFCNLTYPSHHDPMPVSVCYPGLFLPYASCWGVPKTRLFM